MNIPIIELICRYSSTPKIHHQYHGIVNNHLIPALGKIKLNELHPQHIQALYKKLWEQGKSPRTIQVIHSVLRRALGVAERQGLIVRNPAKVVEPLKVPHKEMLILDDNQVRQLMIAAQESRFENLYYLAVTTGLRQGELLGPVLESINIHVSLVHPENCRIIINITTMKINHKPSFKGVFQLGFCLASIFG